MINIFNTQQSIKFRILTHVAFWVAYILFFIVQNSFFVSKTPDYYAITFSLSITAIVDIAAAYFTVYFLFPKFLFKKKYTPFAVVFILSAALAVILQRLLLYYISFPYLYENWADKVSSFWHINPFYSFINIYSVVALFAAIKLFKHYYALQKQKDELVNQNKTSELALLRSQLNPHFMFNTLNNIDSLILTNQEKASDAIIKLSDILRFMIYDTTDLISLEKEINYLKSYISLQQLRFKNPDFVKFTIEGNYTGKNIAPMLFIPFVENAFKHGTKNSKVPGIEIRLSFSENSINFEVMNHFDDKLSVNKDKTSGIGLTNTKRRLELLYTDRHKLTIKKQDAKYIANLTIFLDKS